MAGGESQLDRENEAVARDVATDDWYTAQKVNAERTPEHRAYMEREDIPEHGKGPVGEPEPMDPEEIEYERKYRAGEAKKYPREPFKPGVPTLREDSMTADKEERLTGKYSRAAADGLENAQAGGEPSPVMQEVEREYREKYGEDKPPEKSWSTRFKEEVDKAASGAIKAVRDFELGPKEGTTMGAKAGRGLEEMARLSRDLDDPTGEGHGKWVGEQNKGKEVNAETIKRARDEDREKLARRKRERGE
jgi:hypothetical protein